MTCSSPLSTPNHRHQHGVALLTALIFLVVLTLLGIGVYSTTTSEEKMARNFRDREIALQAAEAALNVAKILITGSFLTGGTQRYPLSENSCFASTAITGFTCDPRHGDPSSTLYAPKVDLYSGSISGAPLNQIGGDSPSIAGVVSQPRYLVIRKEPKDCGASNTGTCFLIIAQGRGRLANTRVNLVELFTN